MPDLDAATHREWLSLLPKDVPVQRCLDMELTLQAVRKDQARAIDTLEVIRDALAFNATSARLAAREGADHA